MVVCLERGADLHIAQLMPLPPTVSYFSKIQIGFTFLVAAHLGSPGKRAVKRVCVCVCVEISASIITDPSFALRRLFTPYNQSGGIRQSCCPSIRMSQTLRLGQRLRLPLVGLSHIFKKKILVWMVRCFDAVGLAAGKVSGL